MSTPLTVVEKACQSEEKSHFSCNFANDNAYSGISRPGRKPPTAPETGRDRHTENKKREVL